MDENIQQRPTEQHPLANFLYAKDDEATFQIERPFMILTKFDNQDKTEASMKTTNIIWERGENYERVTDLRDLQGLPSRKPEDVNRWLDNCGFSFFHDPVMLKATDCKDRKVVEEQYLPSMVRLLETVVEGADEVEIFDWRLRDSSNLRSTFTDMNNPIDPLSPAAQDHLDQSPKGVLKRVRLLMGERAEFLLKGRVRVINVWRPLIKVQDWPLAVLDGSKSSYEDLIEVDLVRRDYIGSTMYAKWKNGGYEWYYLRDQEPSEICLFKNFDSDLHVKATMCPHASFALLDNERLRGSKETSLPRESIEIRALVFTFPR